MNFHLKKMLLLPMAISVGVNLSFTPKVEGADKNTPNFLPKEGDTKYVKDVKGKLNALNEFLSREDLVNSSQPLVSAGALLLKQIMSSTTPELMEEVLQESEDMSRQANGDSNRHMKLILQDAEESFNPTRSYVNSTESNPYDLRDIDENVLLRKVDKKKLRKMLENITHFPAYLSYANLANFTNQMLRSQLLLIEEEVKDLDQKISDDTYCNLTPDEILQQVLDNTYHHSNELPKDVLVEFKDALNDLHEHIRAMLLPIQHMLVSLNNDPMMFEQNLLELLNIPANQIDYVPMIDSCMDKIKGIVKNKEDSFDENVFSDTTFLALQMSLKMFEYVQFSYLINQIKMHRVYGCLSILDQHLDEDEKLVPHYLPQIKAFEKENRTANLNFVFIKKLLVQYNAENNIHGFQGKSKDKAREIIDQYEGKIKKLDSSIEGDYKEMHDLALAKQEEVFASIANSEAQADFASDEVMLEMQIDILRVEINGLAKKKGNNKKKAFIKKEKELEEARSKLRKIRRKKQENAGDYVKAQLKQKRAIERLEKRANEERLQRLSSCSSDSDEDEVVFQGEASNSMGHWAAYINNMSSEKADVMAEAKKKDAKNQRKANAKKYKNHKKPKVKSKKSACNDDIQSSFELAKIELSPQNYKRYNKVHGLDAGHLTMGDIFSLITGLKGSYLKGSAGSRIALTVPNLNKPGNDARTVIHVQHNRPDLKGLEMGRVETIRDFLIHAGYSLQNIIKRGDDTSVQLTDPVTDDDFYRS